MESGSQDKLTLGHVLSLRCPCDIQEQLSISQFRNTDLESRRKVQTGDTNVRIATGECSLMPLEGRRLSRERT